MSFYNYGEWVKQEDINKYLLDLFKKNLNINTSIMNYVYVEGGNGRDLMISSVLNKNTFDNYARNPPDVSAVALGSDEVTVCFVVLHMFGKNNNDITMYTDMDVKNIEGDPHAFDKFYIHFLNAQTTEETHYIAEEYIIGRIKEMIEKVKKIKKYWDHEKYIDTLVRFKNELTADEIRTLSE